MGASLGHTPQRIEIRGWTVDAIHLEYTEVEIVHNGALIGYSGIMRRLESTEGTAMDALLPVASPEDVELMQRVASLSDVERQVVELVVDGHMNKKMAAVLEVAVRTIESRRSRAMTKMKATSLSHLVQMWLRVRQIESPKKLDGNSSLDLDA
jgi:DNA-binding NarL/FixJ family response regulator